MQQLREEVGRLQAKVLRGQELKTAKLALDRERFEHRRKRENLNDLMKTFKLFGGQ